VTTTATITKHPKLTYDTTTPDEERLLIGKAQAGDNGALARLVEASSPLIAKMARRYSPVLAVADEDSYYAKSKATIAPDLYQAGALGLVRAVHAYDLDKSSARLIAFAETRIRKEILAAVARTNRLGRSNWRIEKAIPMVRKLVATCSFEEIAVEMGLSVARVEQLYVMGLRPLPLDVMAGESTGETDPEDETPPTIAETIADPRIAAPDVVALGRLALEAMPRILNATEHKTLVLHAVFEMEPSEIASELAQQYADEPANPTPHRQLVRAAIGQHAQPKRTISRQAVAQTISRAQMKMREAFHGTPQERK